MQQYEVRASDLEPASQLLKCYVEMVHSRVYTIYETYSGDSIMASR
ncbi:ssDNA-binding protein, partial [Salmonella enterica subsp. enterica serovar Newport]